MFLLLLKSKGYVHEIHDDFPVYQDVMRKARCFDGKKRLWARFLDEVHVSHWFGRFGYPQVIKLSVLEHGPAGNQ